MPIPDNITFEQAAVATDSVTTAVHALMERLDVQEGDPVLIMGVGGLGSNGIQIAKHMGAKDIAADIDDESWLWPRIWEQITFLIPQRLTWRRNAAGSPTAWALNGPRISRGSPSLHRQLFPALRRKASRRSPGIPS